MVPQSQDPAHQTLIPGAGPLRILFFADTHLGFDLPQRPRVERRRRGHDFFANFELVLRAALEQEADLVIHGGDLFYRSRVPASLVQRAFISLKRVADRGIPVYIVPGNHERSSIPYPMLALHPGIHIFDRPRTFTVDIRGVKLALIGFPYYRQDVRSAFPDLLGATDWVDADADVNLLCVHHCFEGASVGPSNYTFRYTPDVIKLAEVPSQMAAVLSGHIHRHQILTVDLAGRPLQTSVLYPGSIERTSFAEKAEAKGYLMLEVGQGNVPGGALRHWEFVELPARPMCIHDMTATNGKDGGLESEMCRVIGQAPVDAVLRFRIHGRLNDLQRTAVTAANLREMAPDTMNVEAVLVDERPRTRS